MNKPKHTPGPWRYKISPGEIHKHAVFGQLHPVDGGDYAPLARFAKSEDAKLCAAAPELLAAATKMLAFYEDLAKSNPGFMGKLTLQDYAQWNEALIELPRAIAKATGAA